MKKKKGCWQLGGLLPISQSWSLYSTLYRDTAGAPGHDMAEQVCAGACSRAAIRPAMYMTRLAYAQGRATRACAHGLDKGESRYKNCIVTVGDAETRPAILPGALMTRRAMLAIRRALRATWASTSQYNFVWQRRGDSTAGGVLRQCAQAPRYGSLPPTTQRPVLHDTELCAWSGRSARAACAQPGFMGVCTVHST